MLYNKRHRVIGLIGSGSEGKPYEVSEILKM